MIDEFDQLRNAERTMSGEPTAADDAVEEIREVRRRLWEQFDNDPKKYTAFLQEVGQQLIRDGWPRKLQLPSGINPPPDWSLPLW